MIYRLRKKFIAIVTISFLAVFVALLLTITVITRVQANRELDTLADIISENNGRFPTFEELEHVPNSPTPPQGINPESQFTTRFFTVRFDRDGECVFVDIRSVASVTQEEAVDMANETLQKSAVRGWKNDFRYKKISTENGTEIVFISGAGVKEAHRNFLTTSIFVFLCGSLIVLILVIFLSKRAVKPAAESYEKQKQFITDANHELKTPLTLIRTNLDIMESELGANEWLSDIRDEAENMTELVNKLVTLARMDEEQTELCMKSFDLGEVVSEAVSVFAILTEKSGKTLSVQIDPSVSCVGDEPSIRQLVSVLMDNAVKYCDANGSISVTLHGGKHPMLTVDNSYSDVGRIDLDRLFDRFYRVDNARTTGSGFGVGLSIAKAIAEKHHGNISAININGDTIRFQVRL